MSGLMRWDPFDEMRSLQKQFFNDDWFGLQAKSLAIPTTDVYTNDDKELVVEAHMPNFDESDIDVHVENGALVIRAEKHEKEEDKKKKYVVRESSSSFYRRIHLPKHADQEAIGADMKDGVLTVKVPFKELPQPKKIAINTKQK
ncbi:MAG TPA: Hsp20/alpha crystallin family protein [Candidatus Saccharibacteria bacterium]|jgi:HSP20 family protein|nr:Hsp20/alpha crystallin family protein [Candidatus Saccharibacteria bacterium]HMT56192.1 Hsp20/alpha crystallin family protein [Candidatus Saccharibacteria bacterium]